MNEQQQLRYAELVQLVESHGSKMLSKRYVDEHTAMSVLCPDGHKWRPTPDRLSRDTICSKCTAEERKITPEKVAAKVAEKGGRMLGTYVDTKTSFEVQCHCEYIWATTWDRLKIGCWCRKCAGMVPPTTEEVNQHISGRGGTLLSEYIDSKTPLTVRCQIDHIWHPTWDGLRKGYWCYYCNGNVPLTTEYARTVIESKGGKLLSEYINVRTPLTVQCHIGHIWNPYWPSLKRGCWCPHCNRTAPLTTEYVSARIAERGGQLLSEYVNVRTQIRVRCQDFHIWDTYWPYINRGLWCPHCNRSSGEIRVEQILNAFGIQPQTQYHHPNLPSLRFDFFFEYNGRSYIIEFDGGQHFEFCPFLHQTQDNFIASQIRDTIKTQVALMTNHTVLRIDYAQFDNMETIIDSFLNSSMTGLMVTDESLYSYLIHCANSMTRDVWDSYYVHTSSN